MKVIAFLVATVVLISPPTQAKVVNLDGVIDFDLVWSIRSQLAPGDTLNLNSPGGDVLYAFDLARYVRVNKIDTHVNSTARCSSGCVLIFAAGIRRTAGRGVIFYLHSVGGFGGVGVSTELTQRFTRKLIYYGVKQPIVLDPLGVNLDYEWAKAINLITD